MNEKFSAEEFELVAELKMDETNGNSLVKLAVDSGYLVSANKEFDDFGKFTGFYFISIYKFAD